MKIIKTNEGFKLILNEIGIPKKLEPILWYHQGMFCIIPIEIIKNAYDYLKIEKKFPSKHKSSIISFTWDQGIPVDPKVGYALMGE